MEGLYLSDGTDRLNAMKVFVKYFLDRPDDVHLFCKNRGDEPITSNGNLVSSGPVLLNGMIRGLNHICCIGS